MPTTDQVIYQAIQLLRQSRRVVALTGAGISTPSGIPDFRSPASGLWQHADPMEVASIDGFRQNPQAFYDWLYPLAKRTAVAQPNAAHYALADLEQNGRLHSIITQNIDMLHTKAGSQTVYEIHGHMRQVTCIVCDARFDGDPILQQFLRDQSVPRCPNCGGALKPDVILFGELLPLDILRQAKAAVESCDLILVAGSSLEVSPVSEFPWRAKRHGARLIIVNLGETYLDALADVLIPADVVDALPQLCAVQ